MKRYRHCTGCGIIFSQDNIKDMIEDPVESEFGASWECWERCFYCGTPLTDGILTQEEYDNLDPECQRIEAEKIALIRAKQEKLEQDRKQAREEEQSIQRNGYKCPNCGKHGGQKISTTSRVIGLATLGVLSSNVGKTYKCKHCGYKW